MVSLFLLLGCNLSYVVDLFAGLHEIESASAHITKARIIGACAVKTLWRHVKPRPNDRNMPTQHVATLLGATCCVRLATVLQHDGCCWLKFETNQTWANNTQHVATHRNTVAIDVIIKPRPNDRNISTQHIATLLDATCWARLATMFRRVVMCCDMLGVVGSNLKMVKFFTQHLWMLHDVVVVWPGSYNNVAPRHAH